MRPTPIFLPFVAFVATALITSAAHADDPVDKPQPMDDPVRHAIDRTWLYTDDLPAIALASFGHLA